MSKKRITIPKKLMGKKLEGEWVFLNLENGEYYGLNESGSLVWDELKEKGNPQAATDRLQTVYQVDRARAEKDVAKLLKNLKRHKLIQLEPVTEKA